MAKVMTRSGDGSVEAAGVGTEANPRAGSWPADSSSGASGPGVMSRHDSEEPSSDSGAVPPVDPMPDQTTVPGREARRTAAPSPSGKPEHLLKKPERRLPRMVHQLLAKHAATFCDTLRNDPTLQALIRSNPRNFRADLLAIIRAKFPLRRGRPPDPQLDEAYRMVTQQGKSVSQVARKQFQGWDQRDPYEQYVILKGLRQAVRRRKPRPYKHSRKRKPENPDRSRTKKQH